MYLRSCSIGISRFWFDGLVGFFRVLLEKNLFRFVWLINFFNQSPTRLKRLKEHLRDCSSRKRYSHELPRFNRKWLEKCSIEKRQPYQTNQLRLKRLIPIEHNLIFISLLGIWKFHKTLTHVRRTCTFCTMTPLGHPSQFFSPSRMNQTHQRKLFQNFTRSFVKSPCCIQLYTRVINTTL